MRRRRRNEGIIPIILAFAIGLLACWILPSKFLVGVMVVALLICCFSCNR